MKTTVRIASWKAEGGEGADGFFIQGKGVVGLTGGVGVRRNIVSRAQSHGDFRVPMFRAARFVELSGECLADSPERLDWYNRQLTGLMAEGSATVVFDMPGGPLWAIGELATDPEFDITLWGSRADWMLPLYFANPRLYGETQVSPDPTKEPPGVTATSINRGNFSATSVLTVTGTAPSYTITGPAGRTRTISVPVVAGSPHVIDMATGYLTINGVFVEGASTGKTWAVPGGGTVTQSVAPVSGSVTLSAATKATYI